MKEDQIREEIVKKTLEEINSIENMVGRPMFRADQEEKFEIHIKVDNTIAHGQFVPSRIYPGQWRASEQTFRAMKKDIFMLGDSLDEIAKPYTCESCKTDLDQQFWHFCPFCGESFKE